jgi:hypothetical protein
VELDSLAPDWSHTAHFAQEIGSSSSIIKSVNLRNLSKFVKLAILLRQ